MSTSSFDAFERFQHLRDRRSVARPRSPGEIDEMLDTLDRVFGGPDSVTAERHLRSVRAVLNRIFNDLEELFHLADQAPPEPVLAGFAISAREAVRTLLSAGWSEDSSAAAAVEIELDYDDLHRFMMAPDICMLTPKAS